MGNPVSNRENERIIPVGMGECVVSHNPHTLLCPSIGSCVALMMYDKKKRIGGMAHIMLPESVGDNQETNREKFADTAPYVLLDKMEFAGCEKKDIVAKIAGGAHVFGILKGEDKKKTIGYKNVKKVKEKLKELKIPLVGEDTGGDHGRRIEFDLETGKVRVRAIGKKDIVI